MNNIFTYLSSSFDPRSQRSPLIEAPAVNGMARRILCGVAKYEHSGVQKDQKNLLACRSFRDGW